MHQLHIILIFDNQPQYSSDLRVRIYEFIQSVLLFVEIVEWNIVHTIIFHPPRLSLSHRNSPKPFQINRHLII